MNVVHRFTQSSGLPSFPRMEEAISRIYELLQGLNANARWLIGGSCCLWLQGVELPAPPRDIDIYADLDDAGPVHSCLQRLAVDEPAVDRSGIYVSKLSHYNVLDCPVELVGGFEVHAKGLVYRVQVNGVLRAGAPEIAAGLGLMPLAHELVFNLLRERKDRVAAIVQHIEKEPGQHMHLLRELTQSNGWTKEQTALLERELGNPGWFAGRTEGAEHGNQRYF